MMGTEHAVEETGLRNSKRVDFIFILRPLLILSIIVGHSFAIYSGAWEAPEGLIPVWGYSWVNAFTTHAQLAFFFAISGYLFMFHNDGQKATWQYARRRFLRLYFPAMVFTLLYLWCYKRDSSIADVANGLVWGTAHLWFLPSLFWSYILFKLVAGWMPIEKPKVFLPLALLLLAMRVGLTLLGIGPVARLLNYMLFFLLGAVLCAQQVWLQERLKKIRVPLGILLLVLFVLLRTAHRVLTLTEGQALLGSMVKMASNYLFSTFAIVGLYLLLLPVRLKEGRRTRALGYANSVSFPMYITHQFLLEGWLQQFSLDFLPSHYLIPWFLLALGVVGSLLLVFAMQQVFPGRGSTK